MNKSRLLNLINTPEEISDKEVRELEAMVKNAPYFQGGHILLAKVKHQLKHPDAKEKLTLAAVYATDRALLKKIIMGAPAREAVQAMPATKSVQKQEESLSKKGIESSQSQAPERPEIEKSTTKGPKAEPNISTEISPFPKLSTEEQDALINEVSVNIEELRKNIDHFLAAEKKIDGLLDVDLEEKSEKPQASPKSRKKPVPPKAGVKKQVGTKKKAKKEENKDELILNEISKIKEKPLNKSRQKEQLEIIERFMKTNPSITQRQDVEEEVEEELSPREYKQDEDIHPDLISENLAQIMVNQGKTERAIDIYKKLIWKFPQKKAYFASQIESLKQS